MGTLVLFCIFLVVPYAAVMIERPVCPPLTDWTDNHERDDYSPLIYKDNTISCNTSSHIIMTESGRVINSPLNCGGNHHWYDKDDATVAERIACVVLHGTHEIGNRFSVCPPLEEWIAYRERVDYSPLIYKNNTISCSTPDSIIQTDSGQVRNWPLHCNNNVYLWMDPHAKVVFGRIACIIQPGVRTLSCPNPDQYIQLAKTNNKHDAFEPPLRCSESSGLWSDKRGLNILDKGTLTCVKSHKYEDQSPFVASQLSTSYSWNSAVADPYFWTSLALILILIVVLVCYCLTFRSLFSRDRGNCDGSSVKTSNDARMEEGCNETTNI